MQSQKSQILDKSRARMRSRPRSHSVQSEPKDEKIPLLRRKRSLSISDKAIEIATKHKIERKNSEDDRMQRADSRKRLKSRSSDEGISEQLEGTKI